MTALAAGLQAAFWLACGRPDGMRPLDGRNAGGEPVAAFSFLALVVCIPLEFAQGWFGGTRGRGLAQDVMIAVVSWLAFALVSHNVAVRAGRGALWPRYIAAWNWCSLLQSGLILVALATTASGLPALIGETLMLVTVGWALWLEYFVARVGLGFNVVQAVAMVVLDYAVSQVVSLLMEQLH